MAPELLEDNLFDEKSDVYSFAIVIWEIWDGGVPWHGLQPVQITRKVVDKREQPPSPEGARGPCRVDAKMLGPRARRAADVRRDQSGAPASLRCTGCSNGASTFDQDPRTEGAHQHA